MISFFKQSIEKTEIKTLKNANKNVLQGYVSRGKIPARRAILSKVAIPDQISICLNSNRAHMYESVSNDDVALGTKIIERSKWYCRPVLAVSSQAEVFFSVRE